MALRPDYVTLAEFKAWLRIPLDDVTDDDELGRHITSASRAVDTHCNRQFGLAPAPVAYTATVWGRSITAAYPESMAAIPDLMTAVGMTVTADGSAVDSADWTLLPVNAEFEERPWTGIRVAGPRCAELVVTARWGWTDVPVAVKEATLLQASRFNIRRDSPFGIAGSPDNGSEMRLLARVDPDVAVSLADYVRPRRPA